MRPLVMVGSWEHLLNGEVTSLIVTNALPPDGGRSSLTPGRGPGVDLPAEFIDHPDITQHSADEDNRRAVSSALVSDRWGITELGGR